MTRSLSLHPDRLFSSDPAQRAIARALYAPIRDLPIVFSGGPTAERVAALRSLAPAGLSIYGYDEPGWTAGSVISESPARGPMLSRRRSLATFPTSTAKRRIAPE